MPRALLCLLLVSFVFAPVGCGSFQPAPAASRVILPGDVPSAFDRGLVFLDAEFNGAHPVRLILDTGADATVLTPHAVERLGLQTASMMRVVSGSSGHGVEGAKVRVDRLDLGGLILSDFDAIVMSLEPVEQRLGEPIDGVIGWPAFRDVALIVDYGAQRVSAVDSPSPLGVAYPLTTRRATIEAAMLGEPREYLVDTAFTGAVAIRRDDLNGLEFERLGEDTLSGAYRVEREDRVRVRPASDFGGERVSAVDAFVTKGVRIIGSAWLRRFVVTFDQPSGEIRFEPGSRKDSR